LWVVRVRGDDGELRPWHFLYEGRQGRCKPKVVLGCEQFSEFEDRRQLGPRLGGGVYELRG